jgi:hypothetical protein
LSIWKICFVATPLAFQTIHVSTVVAAHWTSPDAIARWRSFCGIILSDTSRPFFLKIPASLASVSGWNPVQPDMPMATLVSCAVAEPVAANSAAAAKASVFCMDLSRKVWKPWESRAQRPSLSMRFCARYNRRSGAQVPSIASARACPWFASSHLRLSSDALEERRRRTTEIAVYPAGATLDAFLWRVSIADVERDGPFSRFPGIDRTIVLLEGAECLALRPERNRVDDALRAARTERRRRDRVQLLAGPAATSTRCSGAAGARTVAVVPRCGGEFAAPFSARVRGGGTHECAICRDIPPCGLDEGHALLVDAIGCRQRQRRRCDPAAGRRARWRSSSAIDYP